MDRLPNSAQQVFRARFEDQWEVRWTTELREALRDAATSIAKTFRIQKKRLGILPAVYFPRLRMGSVMFHSWGASKADTELAMPWDPTYIPPPFTCFAPPIEEEEEDRVGLITRVASYVDRFVDATTSSLPWVAPTPRDTYVGTVTWTAGEDADDGVVDAEQLLASGVRQVSAIYEVPSIGEPPLYVPILYIQAAVEYGGEELGHLVHAAARAGGGRSSTARHIYAALLAVGRAARLRASQWLNPKTHLLSQAGFDGLKDDLERRVAAGELHAECFFDIDHFKMMNDRFGYVGADLIAAQVVDRVLLEVQRSVANEYAAYRAKKPLAYGKPNGFRALIAHVSGDEFKFFARSNLTASSLSTDSEADRAREQSERIVTAAKGVISAVDDRSRLARTFPIFSTTRLFENQDIVAGEKATVSLGFAVASRDPSWPISQNDALSNYSLDERRLRHARRALNELDGLAERALFGAKRVFARALLSTDLLREGGRLQVRAEADALLLLGRLDGVLEGDEFDVFEKDERAGASLAVVRVRALSEDDRRTAPVMFVGDARVAAKPGDYYVRLKVAGSTGDRFVTAVLAEIPDAEKTEQ